MRDPQGSLHFEGTSVVRQLRQTLSAEHFLKSPLAERWKDNGSIVGFDVVDEHTVVAKRLPFVTHPPEWCDAQLFAAAELTLRLQKEALAAGFDLKDASAWNVIFDGARPVFCDLLSFEPLRERKWWAAGQFARHFIMPLVVSRRCGVRGHESFKVWRDGMPPDVARQMLGPGRFLTRHWPLVAQGSAAIPPGIPPAEAARPDLSAIATFRESLHASMTWMLAGARPRLAKVPLGPWERYVVDREHYDSDAMVTKRQQVSAWLDVLRPAWVADLGCNTGEFSQLAAERGANVVALDADHDSVQRLFRSAPNAAQIYPVVALLDDLPGGRGWAGDEHSSLMQRLSQCFDMVLMLALIHHLVIGASVPLEEVARFAARCTRKWLVVELIDGSDVQLRALCFQRQRDPGDYSIHSQREAFVNAGFVVEAEQSLAPAARSLVLLHRS